MIPDSSSAQPAAKTRVEWVDSARCLAMFFIMWLHVGQAPGWMGIPVGGGICLFFVLAGYFMPREPERAAKRALFLGLAWLLWSGITLGLFALTQPGVPIDWARAFGYGKAAYNTPLWFLRNLALYQLAIAALAALHLLPRANWLLLAVLASLTYVREPAQHEGLRFDWMMAVMLGYCLRSVSLQTIEQWLCRHVWLVLGAILFVLLQREYYPLLARLQGLDYYRCSLPVVQLCYALLMCMAAMGLARFAPRLNRLLATAGGGMMFTYAAHSLLYALIYRYDLPRWCGFAYSAAGIALLTWLGSLLSARAPRVMGLLTAKCR